MEEKQENTDIIIVLGGGISEDGQLPDWVFPRLDRALQLFRNRTAPKILLSGKGRDNFPVAEAEAMGQYLVSKGVPPHNILLECLSRDTLQNAYFSRVVHIGPLQLKSALVITNGFHMVRTKLIFNWVLGNSCQLIFEGVSDEGIKASDLELRAFTEAKLTLFYRRLFQSTQVGDLKALHGFIFDTNNAFYQEYTELGIQLRDKMKLY